MFVAARFRRSSGGRRPGALGWVSPQPGGARCVSKPSSVALGGRRRVRAQRRGRHPAVCAREAGICLRAASLPRAPSSARATSGGAYGSTARGYCSAPGPLRVARCRGCGSLCRRVRRTARCVLSVRVSAGGRQDPDGRRQTVDDRLVDTLPGGVVALVVGHRLSVVGGVDRSRSACLSAGSGCAARMSRMVRADGSCARSGSRASETCRLTVRFPRPAAGDSRTGRWATAPPPARGQVLRHRNLPVDRQVSRAGCGGRPGGLAGISAARRASITSGSVVVWRSTRNRRIGTGGGYWNTMPSLKSGAPAERA